MIPQASAHKTPSESATEQSATEDDGKVGSRYAIRKQFCLGDSVPVYLSRHIAMLTEIAEIILAQETSPTHFEKFCADLLEKIERVPFFTTSASYDRTRDAIGLGRRKGSHFNIVLCTLNRNLESKVREDAERLSKHAKPDRIEYCHNHPLSQKTTDELTKILRDIFPNISVAVKGGEVLSQLAEKHWEVFDKYYGPEVRTISAIATGEPAAALEQKGLVLALVAFGSEDAEKLRKEVSKAAILSAISEKGAASRQEIASYLTDGLQLPVNLNANFIQSILDDSRDAGLIVEKKDKWELTELGKQHSTSLGTEAAEQLLAGRNIIRQKLEVAIGKPLDNSHFANIWATLQDFFAELLYSNGLSTICAVNDVLSGAVSRTDKGNLYNLIHAGAQKVRAITADPELGAELECAVLDIFTERTGDAFEWLARVAERFVALCSLGLEATTADEIRRLLKRYILVLDSDIILTYLCAGEADHEAARELMNRWLALGGEILLAPTVLSEVAAHAWISERSFPDTIHLLGRLQREELPHYTDNAFVRAFHIYAKSSADREKWRAFIGQFQGKAAEDYSNVEDILVDELRAKALPNKFDQDFAKGISDYLKDRAANKKQISIYMLGEDESGKLTRDGQLLAMIAAAREDNRQERTDKTVVIISSSLRLRHADERFRARMHNPEAVMSLSALSYLLSMLPENPLGAGALRRALFEFSLKPSSRDSSQLAMQVIKSAGNYDIPLARRVTLRNQLEKSIRHQAEMRGVRKEDLQRDFERHKPSVPYADIIGETIRNMATKPRELVEAESRIRELQKRIETMENERALTEKKK
jgi:predicted transcriptional regulator